MAILTDNDKIISTLNDLIQTCKDSEDGFRSAGEHVKKPELKRLFKSYSNEREQFVTELQTLVRSLGGQPQEGGSVAAAVHRGWMTLKSTLAGREDRSIIHDCESGEDYALETYQKSIETELPSNVRSLVERQYQHVKKAHDRIRDLDVRFKEKESWKEKPQPRIGERRTSRRPAVEDHSHLTTGF